MLVDPPVTKVLEKVEDRYELITLTAKRARQIAQGAPVLTDKKEKNPVTLAVWEIYEGKVKEENQAQIEMNARLNEEKLNSEKEAKEQEETKEE
jgi:DNA-directed RNA polymerase subunit omega